MFLLSIHYFIRGNYFANNDVVYNIKTPFIQTDFSWDNFYGKEWLSIMHQSCSYFTFRFNLFFADWIKHKRHFVINSFSFWKLIYVNRIRSNVICTYMIIEDLIWSIYMILFSMKSFGYRLFSENSEVRVIFYTSKAYRKINIYFFPIKY